LPASAIIGGVTFVLLRDPQEFASRAGRFIAERLDCNVLGTVLTGVLDGVHGDAPPLFGYALDADGAVQAVAMRLPPWYLLTSVLDPSAASQLVDAWLGEDPEVPGVNGTPATARAVASAWESQTGGATRCRMREAMHVLERVRDPVRAARGALRVAGETDRPLLIRWMEAFAGEAGVVGGERSAAMVDVRLKRGGLLVWDDRGAVAMVGISPPVADLVRIGPVYTPPRHRRRGYASSAVAATSRRALAEGARRCMLFTDLSNLTSNKIYAEIGYQRLADWEEHAFQLPDGQRLT
jgi:predicted GNAT family acetyltransferase